MFRRLKSGVKTGTYSIITGILTILVKLLFGFRVIGREHVEPNGAYIAIARHRSYWDIPMMVAALGVRNQVHFIARRGLMKNVPILRSLIRAFSTVIDRENFTKSDFRKMLEAVRREQLIGLFPEGTTKRRVDASAGAVHFAALAKKDFLPVNIRAEGAYPPRSPFRFPRVVVSIGMPFPVSALNGDGPADEARSERYRRMSLRLMERVDTA